MSACGASGGRVTIAHYRFEVSYRRCLEVDVTQYEAALCPKFERFDDAHGDYGGCLWPSKIRGERHGLIWTEQNVFPNTVQKEVVICILRR